MREKLLVGAIVGRLTVLSEGVGKQSGARIRRTWVCRCTCGEIVTVMDQSIRSGRTLSCGCLAKQVARHTHTRHGETVGRKQSKTYTAWRDMIQRCTNPAHKSYHNYGGRGLTVCPEWLVFDRFLSDMGEVPDGLTLDRKKAELGYFKDNCHWADWDQQAANKRRGGTQMISYEGITQSPKAWAETLGISLQAIRIRRRKGWPIDQILSKDIFTGKNRNGKIGKN